MCLLTAAPAVAGPKTKRTLYTEAKVQKAREKVANLEWARKQVETLEENARFFTQMSDEELWNYVPPGDQFRALNVNFGADCPIHGAEIHRAGGHYPWIMSRDKPFKLECPVGHEVYPTNDFQPWWTSNKPRVTPENSSPHEKYVDEGAGWVSENGTRYWFVPHYVFWQRWKRDILPGIQTLAQAYLLTGKPIYGHKCAVMLARISEQYPDMDIQKQTYWGGSPATAVGKLQDRIWETDTVTNLATAYDAIFPATAPDADPDLQSFLKTKQIPDLRTAIEQNILQVMAQGIFDNIIKGNMGMHQRAMANLALVLDNDDPAKGHTTREMVEWILKSTPGKLIAGETDELFYNGFYRDGHGSESSPFYSSLWNRDFYDVAKSLEPLGVNLFAQPKMKKLADILLDMTVADNFTPAIGDSGSVRGAGKLWNANVFKEAWRRYHDPRYAVVLAQMGVQDRDLWSDPLEDEIKAAVERYRKEHGTDKLLFSSRNLGGFGVAILERGRDETKRAVSLYYGSASGGHGHADRLTTEAWFFGKPFLTEHGYPAHWLPKYKLWTGNTISHYAVVVDRQGQTSSLGGRLEYLAESPTAQVMEASSEKSYGNTTTLYRHTTAMVDLSPTRSYLFDVWRVKGGGQHDWSFHGIPFANFSSPQIDWSPVQKTGTLAGENVAFGAKDAPEPNSGFQYLFNVQRGRPSGGFTSEWKSTKDDTALRMTLLNPPALVIAADCEPELAPYNPREMKYLIARNVGPAGGKSLESVFTAVIEPVKGESRVRAVEALQPTVPAPGFAGARVTTVDDDGTAHTDYVLSGMGSTHTVRLPNDLAFAGRFAVAAEERLFLVDGTLLQQGKWRIEAKPLTAKISAVDPTKNEITLDKLLTPRVLLGKVITISNELHSTSYTILSAENRGGKTVLGFGDVLPVIARGQVAKTDAAKGEVVTSTRLSGQSRVDGGQFQGRWLTNTARSLYRRIRSFDIETSTFQLEGKLPSDAFPDDLFFIVDFGVGDSVSVPSVQSVRRTAPGQYRIQTTVPITLSLPAAAGPHFIHLGKEWKALPASRDGVLTLRLDPRDFAMNEAILIIDKPAALDLETLAATLR
jgi:hypothetical protein